MSFKGPELRFQTVQFAYPFRPDVQASALGPSPCCWQVLKGVSFVLEAGTSAGLVGPSGGGKSTVMASRCIERCVRRLLRP